MVMALNDLMWEPGGDWRNDAACVGTDIDVFFPIGDNEDLAVGAKKVCGGCPVREACLRYALSTNQTEGVWGGLTGPERRRLRRRIRERQRRAS